MLRRISETNTLQWKLGIFINILTVLEMVVNSFIPYLTLVRPGNEVSYMSNVFSVLGLGCVSSVILVAIFVIVLKKLWLSVAEPDDHTVGVKESVSSASRVV